MMLQLCLSMFMLFAEGRGLQGPEIQEMSFDRPPGEVLQSQGKLNGQGQITLHGHILLADYKNLLDYTTYGEFVRKIEVKEKQTIRCQTYDADRHLYVLSVWDEHFAEDRNRLEFFHANGARVDQEPVTFELDGKAMNVNQMRYLGDDLYLLNIWGKSFNQQLAPKTLVVAKRVIEGNRYRLKPVSEPFDAQSGAMRQFKDNFVDRWVVFSEDSERCAVAHLMVPELRHYQIMDAQVDADSESQESVKNNAENEQNLFRFQVASVIQPLNFKVWQEKKYPHQLWRKSKSAGFSRAEENERWFDHFSRLSGLYALGGDMAVLGMTTPNTNHRYYRQDFSQAEGVEDSSHFSLFLSKIALFDGDDSVLNSAGSVQMQRPIHGGILLGTFDESTFVLKEVVAGENGQEGNGYQYNLLKVRF